MTYFQIVHGLNVTGWLDNTTYNLIIRGATNIKPSHFSSGEGIEWVEIDEPDNWDYVVSSLKQLGLGNFTEDVTLLGTGLQIGAGVFGVDAILDARDIVADVAQWEWTKDHAIQTGIDVIALIPLVGALKYSDEALVLVKSGDKAYAVTKNVGEIIDVAKHLDDVLPALKNTDNFASGKLKHIFSGEINKWGDAKGFHYEGLSGVDGKVIKITKAPNKYGVYEARVEVGGKVKDGFP